MTTADDAPLTERLQLIRPGLWRTHDGRYEIRQVPRNSGRNDAGTWHVGYPDGEAITDSSRTMLEQRWELADIRKEDWREQRRITGQ